MTAISDVYLYALIPVISILVGGVTGLFTTPSGAFKSSVLHFAGGVVFSVVAVELLPDIIKNHKPIEVGIGFSLGIVTMLLVKFFAEKFEEKQENKTTKNALPIGLLVALGIDLAIDGLLLGVGFAAGNTEGILLSVALALETFSLGLAVVLACINYNFTKQKNLFILLVLGLIFFSGAILGITLLSGLSQEWLELVLSFGLAALLFLVTEELLTEAHEEKETLLQTAMFFVGFLIFLLIGMIA
ncbi:ZIP family metal transporter [Flavobacterium sp. SUN046]|uniref:ZIP family metal transporter n=1 Tax=Flavobacterium sp. SUN046 TaxID=3002440 RepID=UPI002DB6C7A8|nr:ZIP family metal transporter [Flavobacterium sp. SUN046]MEC4048565.1 ZIP family metal transporter [Flavobacterium sp. SUN046]